MNSKDRFLLAADHKTADRIPMDIGNFFPGDKKLVKDLMAATGQQSIEGILRYLGIDRREVVPRYIGPERFDEKGRELSIWGVPADLGFLSSDEKYLSKAASVDEIESHEWPLADWFDFSNIEEQCDRYSDYAVSGGFWGSLRSKVDSLLGMQNAMIAMYENPDIVKTIVKKAGEFFRKANKRFFEAAKGKIDVFMTAEDLGTQNSILMSIEMFKEFYYDEHKRIIDEARPYVKKIMFHSCGSISKYLPILIDMGVDIINPIQVRASNMDPEYLKDTFGDRLCFHGGIDTQFTLPGGTEEMVRSEVRERIGILGRNGGYILAPSQDFLPDIPVRNIIAMYDEGKRYQVHC